MPRKVITDWDEYFEHRQEVQYQVWKRWYKNRLGEARDKEFAHQIYSQRLHMLDAINTPMPDGRFGGNITSDEKSIGLAYDAQVGYYTRLYESFNTTWQLHQRGPVTIFLRNTAPEIVRMYRLRLADPFDWDQQLEAQTEAAEYIQSNLGKKKIVDWLCFCAARERFIDHLEISEDLTDQDDIKSVNHSVVPLTNQSDSNVVTLDELPNHVVKKSEAPRTGTAQTNYVLIVAKMRMYMGNGMSKKAAMLEVGREVKRSGRVIYEAIKGSGL